MDDTTEVIKNYEELLKKNAQKTTLPLYSSKGKNGQFSKGQAVLNPQDIITNLTSQLKAIQQADTVTSENVRNCLIKCKNSSFVPVNMLPKDVLIPQPTHANKFETQFELDTQLLDVIVNAEELIDDKNGITQEFNSIFQIDHEEIRKHSCIDSNSSSSSQENNGNSNNKEASVATYTIHNPSKEKKQEISKCNNDFQDLTQFNENEKCSEAPRINIDKKMVSDDIADDDLPCSYIFEPLKKSNTPSPLVFDLNSFEDFEKIAIPIIEEHPNIKSVKHLINSQIVGRELLIQTDDMPQFCTGDTPLSPVLQITTDKLNVPKHVNSDNDTKENDHISVSDLMKDSVFLKDEIIFSSDEESEYIHKHSQDLPLTCALETSFYNQSQVLDKTMYVCFQTASSRSIQVCTESYAKAKSFLDDSNEDKNKVTLTELVEICDIPKKTVTSHSQKNANVKDISIKIDLEEDDIFSDDVIITKPGSKQKAKDVNKQNVYLKSIETDKLNTNSQSCNVTAPVKRKYDGFTTASNKKIKLSAQALARCKEVFQDIDLEDNLEQGNALKLENDVADNIQNEISTVDSNHIDEDILSEFNEEMPLIENKQQEIKECVGFQIASNKKYLISDTALAKSKKISDDLNTFEPQDVNNLVPDSRFSENINTDSKNDCIQDALLPDIAGFKTASNKNIGLPQEAFVKLKNIPKESIDIEINSQYKCLNWDQPTTSKQHVCEFKTASNKEICVSSEALAKSRLLKDIIEHDTDINTEYVRDSNKLDLTHPNPDIYVCFRTANNKAIAISEKAYSKTKNMFNNIMFCEEDIDKIEEESKKQYTDVKDTEIELELQEVSKLQQEICDDFSKGFDNIPVSQATNVSNFCDFKTASNKSVKVSEKAICESKKLFADLDLDNDFECFKDISMKHNNKSKSEDNINLKQVTNIAKSKTCTEKETVNQLPFEKSTTAFAGFETAINKDVMISKKGLAKSKQLFSDLEFENLEKEDDKISVPKNGKLSSYNRENIIPKDQSFQMASRKPIHISDKALEKSKALFKDFDDENISKSTKPEACKLRLETANKKPIQISAQAMAKSLAIFKETEIIDYIDKCLDSKGNGKEITDWASNKTTTFNGFKTASNKPVQISKEALIKSAALFQDIVDGNIPDTNQNNVTFTTFDKKSDDEGPIFKGFETASRKPVMISKEALAKSNVLLNDIVNEDLNHPNLCQEGQNTDKVSIFKGFQTASRKLVKVSAESLAKSNALFKDIINDEINNPKEVLDTNNPKAILDTNTQSVFKGFQTASKKPVKISAESLAKSRALFKDIDNDVINNPKEILDTNIETNVKGFQTASKKPVKISAESLAKSRALFNDIDNDDINNLKEILNTNIQSDFKGFQTASKKAVKISAESLAKSRALFKDVDNDDINNPKEILDTNMETNFKGFQTASKKPVKISAVSLAKSRALFKDIDNDDINNPKEILDTNIQSVSKGFQTASKKPVKISAESLAKSRALFKDIDNEDTVKPKICQEDKSVSPKESIFRGFETASRKAVQVSADALAKSKLLFKDIDDCQTVDNTLKFHGFTSGNNKIVTVSDDALVKSKNLLDKGMGNEFSGLQTASKKKVLISEEESPNATNEYKKKENCDNNVQKTPFSFKSANNNRIDVSQDALIKTRNLFTDANKNNKPENSLEQLIDTQVIYNFEETLHTEDFCKDTTPRQSKRSGSPILSCPKPKRRKKFETPYRNEILTRSNIIPHTESIMESNYDTEMLFNEDYKKTKRYTLKDLADVEKNSPKPKPTMYSFISNYNFDTLLSFKFNGNRNDVTETEMSTEDIKKIFLNNVNKKLIPDGWLDNHIKLIIWKLLCYEIMLPNTLSGVCTVKNMLDQLKYRYDKELYNAERPALRKILEKDDVASKTMVLCVAAVYVDGVSVSSVPTATSNIELLLTDGWYCIKATIDRMLTKLVYDERIRVGCKIVTNGAELVNCEQGVAPWEDTSSVRLKLFGNATRRARWDARLGYHGNAAILAPLSAVKVEGGKVSKLRLYVARVYPALFVEKFEDGSTVTRSERLETIHQVKYESERQAVMEKLYEEVEKELSDQESQDSECSFNNRRKLYNESQLISNTQTRSLEERSNRRREKLIQDIQTKLHDKMEAHGLNVSRNVIPLLKVRVAGLEKDSTEVTKGLMSIWKPNDAITEIIREGMWIEVLNVVPTAIRYSEIQISAGRNSIFRESKFKASDKMLPYINNLKRKCYHIKELTKNPTMSTDYNEIDTAGLIFQIDPKTADFESSKQSFQNMYLADGENNIICVNFWGGLKKFGYHNVLDTGQVVACVNLQKRSGNTKKNIPHYRVTEFSYFTKTPKNIEARNMVEELVKKFSGLDKRKYCEEYIVYKNNFNKSVSYNNENISPYRINNIHNLTRNKVFIDSPLAQKPLDENLNLTGLDFESTFKQNTQDASPEVLLRRKKVNEKIAKLKMYGEPPPLSHIHIINKSNSALNSYKSPLTNVASVKKDAGNSRKNDCNIQSSPVLAMNRTFVKTVQPVKLNFSNAQNDTAEDIDHFAEEFDGSPPLSLD